MTNVKVLDIRDNPKVTMAAEDSYGAADISMPDEQKLREKLLKLTQLKCDPQFSVSLLSMKSEVTNIISFCTLIHISGIIILVPSDDLSKPRIHKSTTIIYIYRCLVMGF